MFLHLHVQQMHCVQIQSFVLYTANTPYFTILGNHHISGKIGPLVSMYPTTG